jgi:outer membrane protein insertion porin family
MPNFILPLFYGLTSEKGIFLMPFAPFKIVSGDSEKQASRFLLAKIFHSFSKFFIRKMNKEMQKKMVRLCLLLFLGCFLRLSAQAQIRIGYQGGKSGSAASSVLNYANPKDYVIAALRVEGANYLDHQALIAMSGLKVGDKIQLPGEDLGFAIRKLWKQGLMGDIAIHIEKIEGENVSLVLKLTERPRLSRFDFEGISKSHKQTLTDKISLIRGKIVTDVTLKNTENVIRQFYQEKAYKNVKVRIVQQKDTLLSNSVMLKIRVDKGEKVRIGEIIFEGVSEMEEKKLRRKMKKTKQRGGFNLFTPSKFIAKEYKKDKENIISFYNKNGYRDAQIVSDSVYDIDAKNVGIKLRIREGKPHYYRNIKWIGNTIYSDTLLSSVLGISKGDIYNPEDLQKRLNFNPAGLDITALYMDDGYLFFNIQPVEVRIENDSIDIEMRIFEGEQAIINRVTVKGNTRTSDHVILRELYTVPGQKFSRTNLIRTQQQLAQMGYFDPERIGIDYNPNINEGTVDIHYSVVEKPSDQIELSGGWGGFLGFVGTVGLQFNNFSLRKVPNLKTWKPLPQGDGQQLALRIQANGRQFQTYSFSFTEPWLGGKKPNTLSFSLQHSVNRILNPFTRQTQGTLLLSGVTLSTGRRLKFPDNYFQVLSSISYTRYLLDNYNARFRNISNGTFNKIFFSTTISRSNVDSPIYPRSGATLSLNIGLTPPYSLFDKRNVAELTAEQQYKFIEYHKWMFDNSWYFTLGGNFVLSARTHFGYIGSYNKNRSISPFDRFILGGAGLTFGNFLLGSDIIALRGYEDNTVVPYDLRDEGGVIYEKFVLELRHPVTLNQTASIYLQAFVEAGNSWSSPRTFQPFDLKRSAGVGARIFMPAFGLLGIDWAYGFDRIDGFPNSRGPQFHFTIGQMPR